MRPFTSLPRGLRSLQSAFPRATITRASQTSSRPFTQLLHRQIPTLYSPKVTTHLTSTRLNSSSAKPLTDRSADASTDAQNEEQNRLRREQEPAYQITFTCKPCGERSSHRMSKHGYHRGTVLIKCPSCDARHVIADHLNIFFDKKSTLEDILARQGDKLTRGYVDGDMEFWDDGSVNKKEGGGEGEEGKSA
ncbi:hypothetical protein ASPFODRAFT_147032 [Aspergillus luchuensis CBS 106.47]|uniref:DNL-type domain-containing protein n=1 Tax=Aspergillus luchuensis (strain CBS 106.47) TaxID=1137211 RepID=A0A1M3T2I0_ASPLC|nr:hypothetical protein ASPFODRAFT_147032 [Aspergillus luchuensis CBS 106.47]